MVVSNVSSPKLTGRSSLLVVNSKSKNTVVIYIKQKRVSRRLCLYLVLLVFLVCTLVSNGRTWVMSAP